MDLARLNAQSAHRTQAGLLLHVLPVLRHHTGSDSNPANASGSRALVPYTVPLLEFPVRLSAA